MVRLRKIERLILIFSITAIIISLFTMVGCGPKMINPIRIPEINIEETESFVPEEKLEKPEKPEPIYLNKEFARTMNKSEIKYFAFSMTEFAKVLQLSKSFDAQETLLDEYVILINADIEIINRLKELIALKGITTEHFANLYANEQNLRLQEEYQHSKDSFFYKTIFLIQNGLIVAIAIL